MSFIIHVGYYKFRNIKCGQKQASVVPIQNRENSPKGGATKEKENKKYNNK